MEAGPDQKQKNKNSILIPNRNKNTKVPIESFFDSFAIYFLLTMIDYALSIENR